MHWEPGRQGTGYEKLKLFSSKLLKCDCYILRYRPGSFIGRHLDPAVKGYEHHRLNVLLKSAEKGGRGWIEIDKLRPKLLAGTRAILFRPDIMAHGVERVALCIKPWLAQEGYLVPSLPSTRSRLSCISF